MGGNGAYDHYRKYSLDIYEGDRFNEIGTIGNNKVVSISVYDLITGLEIKKRERWEEKPMIRKISLSLRNLI